MNEDEELDVLETGQSYTSSITKTSLPIRPFSTKWQKSTFKQEKHTLEMQKKESAFKHSCSPHLPSRTDTVPVRSHTSVPSAVPLRKCPCTWNGESKPLIYIREKVDNP